MPEAPAFVPPNIVPPPAHRSAGAGAEPPAFIPPEVVRSAERRMRH